MDITQSFLQLEFTYFIHSSPSPRKDIFYMLIDCTFLNIIFVVQ